MTWNRWLDESARDYTVERGNFKRDSTARSKVLIRLMTKRGALLASPEIGTRIFELVKSYVGEATLRMAETLTEDALADLVAAGELRALDVTASPVFNESGTKVVGIQLEVAYEDRLGARDALSHLHKL